MTEADRRRDSYGSWSLAIASWREIRVRAGEYAPVDDIERRWASEGPCEVCALETVIRADAP